MMLLYPQNPILILQAPFLGGLGGSGFGGFRVSGFRGSRWSRVQGLGSGFGGVYGLRAWGGALGFLVCGGLGLGSLRLRGGLGFRV